MGSTYYVLHYYEHQRGFSKSLLLDPPFSYTAIAIGQISNINKFGIQTWIKILVHEQKKSNFLSRISQATVD